jgi:hypothetical protein
MSTIKTNANPEITTFTSPSIRSQKLCPTCSTLPPETPFTRIEASGIVVPPGIVSAVAKREVAYHETSPAMMRRMREIYLCMEGV